MTAWEGINDFGEMGGAEAGRVVVIHLDHEGLTGEVPAAFGGLTGRGLHSSTSSQLNLSRAGHVLTYTTKSTPRQVLTEMWMSMSPFSPR
jgi:hypothetical protein